MDFLVLQGKYLGIIVFLVLTGCGLPIPEEVPIVLAGIWSAKAPLILNPWLAYFSCVFGALLGDAVMYGIGYRWGHGLFSSHPYISKFLHADREEKFEQAIQRHGLKVMLLARFMVGIRGPVYLAAGVVRIPFRRFFMMDLVAATLVVSLFFGLSHFFGRHIIAMIQEAEIWLTAIVLVVITIAGIYFWRRGKRITRSLTNPTNGETEGSPEPEESTLNSVESSSEKKPTSPCDDCDTP